MAAGRVPADVELLRVATVPGRVLLHPGERPRDVLDVVGVLDRSARRAETVVDDRGADTLLGERLTEGRVHFFLPGPPGSAVDEHHDGELRGSLREEQVQLVLDRIG